MKKLILLALVALVAGAAFAQTTPAFSGEFRLNTTLDFENETYKIGSRTDAKVILSGVVSDWATVDAELGVDDPDVEDGFNSDGAPMLLNSFALTTDITGALGSDGPVGVTFKWGYVNHEAAEYNGVAGYEDIEPTSETGSYFGFVLTLVIVEKVNLIILMPPSTYTGYDVYLGEEEVGPLTGQTFVISAEIQFLGLVDGLDFNVWYTRDQNNAVADHIYDTGLTLGYVMGPLSIGAGVKYDMAPVDNTFGAFLGLQYLLGEAFTGGLAFGAGDFNNFTDTSAVGINATWHAVMDTLDVYAAVSFPFTNIDTGIGIEGGIEFFLAGVTYTLGYDYQGAGFQSPQGPGLYFDVQAEF